jgi:hypothetical protein
LRSAAREVVLLSNVFDCRINDRPIGDIRWGELTKLIVDNATDAAHFLGLGFDATFNAVLVRMVKEFVTVDDHSKTVRQVLTAAQMQKLIDAASAEAPYQITVGQRQYIKQIQSSEVQV